MPRADDLEAALRGLTPVAPALDRDRLMYQAGRASRAGAGRCWAIAVGLLAVALAPLTIRMSLNRPEPRGQRMVVRVPSTAPQPLPHQPMPPPQPPLPYDQPPYLTEERGDHSPDVTYFRAEKSVLRWGLDGLPSSPAPPVPVRPADPLPRVRGRF
ncbi:MAG: hypothetical protein FJ271_18265 [Planctomycetes bacterium]|nr:hypothetical protein [Planctomycetota bacterium]